MDVKNLEDTQPHPTTAIFSDEDDVPTLSPYALEALQQFLAEQSQSQTTKDEERENDDNEEEEEKVELLTEDWRLSQFWYSPETANTVAHEVFSLLSRHFAAVGEDISPPPSVACIACPTLFAYLKIWNLGPIF